MSNSSLNFWKVYRMTRAVNGKDADVKVAFGVKQKEAPLSDGTMGVELRWLTNGPYERSERVAVGGIALDEDGVVELRHDEDENFTITTFEPLTLKLWKEMRGDISDYDRLAALLDTDEKLCQWYWSEYVPDYWVEDQPADLQTP